jgi:hypothetical protein
VLRSAHGLERNYWFLVKTISDLEQAAGGRPRPWTGDYFDLVPYDAHSFLSYLDLACHVMRVLHNREPATLRFLDIGCGIGTKVHLAGQLGLDAYGLELRRDYCKLADLLVPGRICQGDALTHSCYGDYDILFFYRPIRHGEMERRLEKRVYADAKEGAVVIGVGPTHYGDRPPRFMLRIFEGISVKVKSRAGRGVLKAIDAVRFFRLP